MSRYRLGPGVFVPARTAALLSRLLDLDRRRIELRGADSELDEVLNDWRQVVVGFVGSSQLSSGSGFDGETRDDEPSQPGSHCEQLPSLVGTAQVADLLDMTEQAVTRAAREGRLTGRQTAGRWQFELEHVAIFQTRRTR
jgi:hypothetical protein